MSVTVVCCISCDLTASSTFSTGDQAFCLAVLVPSVVPATEAAYNFTSRSPFLLHGLERALLRSFHGEVRRLRGKGVALGALGVLDMVLDGCLLYWLRLYWNLNTEWSALRLTKRDSLDLIPRRDAYLVRRQHCDGRRTRMLT